MDVPECTLKLNEDEISSPSGKISYVKNPKEDLLWLLLYVDQVAYETPKDILDLVGTLPQKGTWTEKARGMAWGDAEYQKINKLPAIEAYMVLAEACRRYALNELPTMLLLSLEPPKSILGRAAGAAASLASSARNFFSSSSTDPKPATEQGVLGAIVYEPTWVARIIFESIRDKEGKSLSETEVLDRINLMLSSPTFKGQVQNGVLGEGGSITRSTELILAENTPKLQASLRTISECLNILCGTTVINTSIKQSVSAITGGMSQVGREIKITLEKIDQIYRLAFPYCPYDSKSKAYYTYYKFGMSSYMPNYSELAAAVSGFINATEKEYDQLENLLDKGWVHMRDYEKKRVQALLELLKSILTYQMYFTPSVDQLKNHIAFLAHVPSIIDDALSNCADLDGRVFKENPNYTARDIFNRVEGAIKLTMFTLIKKHFKTWILSNLLVTEPSPDGMASSVSPLNHQLDRLSQAWQLFTWINAEVEDKDLADKIKEYITYLLKEMLKKCADEKINLPGIATPLNVSLVASLILDGSVMTDEGVTKRLQALASQVMGGINPEETRKWLFEEELPTVYQEEYAEALNNVWISQEQTPSAVTRVVLKAGSGLNPYNVDVNIFQKNENNGEYIQFKANHTKLDDVYLELPGLLGSFVPGTDYRAYMGFINKPNTPSRFPRQAH